MSPVNSAILSFRNVESPVLRVRLKPSFCVEPRTFAELARRATARWRWNNRKGNTP